MRNSPASVDCAYSFGFQERLPDIRRQECGCFPLAAGYMGLQGEGGGGDGMPPRFGGDKDAMIPGARVHQSTMAN
jgi:hypothetical protein